MSSIISTNKLITRAVARGLADYLKAAIPTLLSAYQEFPDPSQRLDYPSLSVFMRNPTFKPYSDPYVIYKGPKDVSANAFPIRRVVGIYEFSLQVDLWCGSKYERDALYEQIFQAMQPSPGRVGLTIQLTDYYDSIAEYDLTAVSYSDGESAAQRKEWRATVSVSASCSAIRETLEYLMETIENTLEITEQIPEDAGLPPTLPI